MSKLINIIQDRYSVIPNEVFTDRRLDYRSRGVLCTLLSLPNGWDFSILGLAELAKIIYYVYKNGTTSDIVGTTCGTARKTNRKPIF